MFYGKRVPLGPGGLLCNQKLSVLNRSQLIWSDGRLQPRLSFGMASPSTSLGFPLLTPDSGEVVDAPIERQTELVLEQLKFCVETAGSSLANVLKMQCLLHIGRKGLRKSMKSITGTLAINRRAVFFVAVPVCPGHFDIEVECIAAV